MGVAWVARLGNHGRQGSARMGLIGEVDHGRLGKVGIGGRARQIMAGMDGRARQGLEGSADHGRLDVTCRSVRMRNVAVTGSQFSKATDEFQGVLPLLVTARRWHFFTQVEIANKGGN